MFSTVLIHFLSVGSYLWFCSASSFRQTFNSILTCDQVKQVFNRRKHFHERKNRKSSSRKYENWHSNCNCKIPVSGSLIGRTWIILGVLCNVTIWIDSEGGPRSILCCGRIFDFGIWLTICLEISFLMIITSEPISAMYMHMA